MTHFVPLSPSAPQVVHVRSAYRLGNEPRALSSNSHIQLPDAVNAQTEQLKPSCTVPVSATRQHANSWISRSVRVRDSTAPNLFSSGHHSHATRWRPVVCLEMWRLVSQQAPCGCDVVHPDYCRFAVADRRPHSHAMHLLLPWQRRDECPEL